jgi:hypothetical protein
LEDWQPISTAPLDTEIEVCVIEGEPHVLIGARGKEAARKLKRGYERPGSRVSHHPSAEATICAVIQRNGVAALEAHVLAKTETALSPPGRDRCLGIKIKHLRI